MASTLNLRAKLFAGWVFFLTPASAFSATPFPESFRAIAGTCAPSVDADTLGAVAKVESNFDALALHDNTTSQQEAPASLIQAETDAGRWLSRGDSVDIGLMQINSANFSALGLTIESALDPCASLAAGAAILRAAYGGGNTPVDQQVALLMALSRYNTGSPVRGIMNGYVRTVLANMADEDEHVPQPLATGAPVEPSRDPSAPADWNVSAAGSYAEVHGAPWLISLSLTQKPASAVR